MYPAAATLTPTSWKSAQSGRQEPRREDPPPINKGHLRMVFSLQGASMTPLHPIVEALLSRLDDNCREAFEERAGIMQFEAGHPRELAEALAMLEVVRTDPLAVSGVHHLRLQVQGEVVSVLTLEPTALRERLGNPPGALDRIDLAEAVARLGLGAVLCSLPETR